MTQFFSVITPTLQRHSLIETCQSLDVQTFDDWQHIIMVDREEIDFDLIRELVPTQRRRIIKCEKAHVDGGNTCRHKAWNTARGSWIIYLDDDNRLSDSNVLRDLAAVLQELPEEQKWAIFPIDRLGLRFYTDPPKSCHIDTLNLVLRKEVAQWPQTDAYGSDGVLVEDLMARGIPYAAFPDFRPIGIIPRLGFCQ